MSIRKNLAAVLCALSMAAPAAAQEAPDNATVGAPELRGFRLPGTRVVPPPTAQPEPEPAAPPPAAERTVPAPSATARTPAPSQAERPAPRITGLTAAPAAASPAPSNSEEAAPQDIAASPAQETYPIEELEPAPAALTLDQPGQSRDDLPLGDMMWPALVGGLALLVALLFFQRRRRAAMAGDGAALERAAFPKAAPPAPAPARRPVAVQLRDEDEAQQPLLELEFRPERMVATDSQAAVHFALFVRNGGQAAARNVRVEAQMFNASAHQNQEIAAFLAMPTQIDAGAASLSLQPGQAVQLQSTVVMPKQNVREIRIDGLSLFIPTVAVRIVYQWGRGRSGQTFRTYLVGIENQKSPQKMGPFRLDQGPRIYRSVGGRQIEMARAS